MLTLSWGLPFFSVLGKSLLYLFIYFYGLSKITSSCPKMSCTKFQSRECGRRFWDLFARWVNDPELGFDVLKSTILYMRCFMIKYYVFDNININYEYIPFFLCEEQ